MPKVHTVSQGECLSSTARQYGFKDWTVLYDDPANAELKKRRPNPNVLYPGDLVAIPEPKSLTAQRPIGDVHELAVEAEEPRLKVRLVNGANKPLANQDYQLTVDGQDRSGTTTDDGLVDEPIDAKSRSAVLKTTITRDDDEYELVWNLDVGTLDPISTTSGIQGRLRNLQLYSGPINGNYDAETRNSLMTFQRAAGLDVTGQVTDDTLNELEKQHDGKE